MFSGLVGNARNDNILVVGSTGNVGTQVCKQLVEAGFSVFGTTRNPESKKLSAINVQAVEFQYGDRGSIDAAIAASKAGMVFFIVDFFGAAGGKPEVEVEHGKIIVDACVTAGINHVVFSSVANADDCPDAVKHFHSKEVIENYMREQESLSFSILRPVTFFENLDNPVMYNPLTKGSVKMLWRHDLKVKHVGCADIAKAAVVMFKDPRAWKGKTLDCVSCEVTGDEIASALSQASGVRCTYKVLIPSFIMRLAMRDLYNMVAFFENPGYSSSVEEFKAVVPDAQSPLDFFQAKGQWGNGEPFAPLEDGNLADPPTKCVIS